MPWLLWLITFEPMDLLPIVPGLVLTIAARRRIGRVASRAVGDLGATGAAIGRAVLEAGGRGDVAVIAVPGPMSDLCDAPMRTLRLSPPVHDGRSPLAAAIASHAAALATLPRLARLAAGLRLLAGWGGLAAWMTVGAGIMLRYTQLAVGGMALFSAVAVGSLLSVPIAMVGGRVARRLLEQSNLVDASARSAVGQALGAAVWQTVAVPLTTRPVRIRGGRDS